MKTLIVYYSFTRNNEILALDLQERLHCDILKIEEMKKRTILSILLDLIFGRTPRVRPSGVLLEAYDNIIFVSPVWGGKIASPLKSFLLREKDSITQYSFITLCGGGSPDQHDKIAHELAALVQQEPEAVAELSLSDLPKDKAITKIRQEDLLSFEPKITEFLQSCNAPVFQV